jgi:hypothetical protein
LPAYTLTVWPVTPSAKVSRASPERDAIDPGRAPARARRSWLSASRSRFHARDRVVNLRPDRSLKLAFEVYQVGSTFDRAFHAFMSRQGEVAIGDRKLKVMNRLEAPKGSAALDVHPGSEFLAFSTDGEVAVTDLRGHTLFADEHDPWPEGEVGSCAFSDDGEILLVAGRVEAGIRLSAVPWRARAGQRSAVDLQVVEQTRLIWQRWPIRGRWTLWAGAGQDGTWTWFVSLDGTQLHARQVEALAGRSAAPPAIHPGGHEFVSAEYERIDCFSVDGEKKLASVEVEPEGEDDEGYEQPSFFGPGLVVATHWPSEAWFLFDAATLERQEELTLDQLVEPTFRHALCDGSFLAISSEAKRPSTIGLYEPPAG